MKKQKHPLIAKAIKIAGKQELLAKGMNCAQQTISKLLNHEIPVSAEHAAAIHRATKGAVSKAELRPDLFGNDASQKRAS